MMFHPPEYNGVSTHEGGHHKPHQIRIKPGVIATSYYFFHFLHLLVHIFEYL